MQPLSHHYRWVADVLFSCRGYSILSTGVNELAMAAFLLDAAFTGRSSLLTDVEATNCQIVNTPV